MQLVQQHIERIEARDRRGPSVTSVLKLNPDALQIARDADAERKGGRVRGPLHGIPLLIKGNIDSAYRITSTAGSLALLGAPAPQGGRRASPAPSAG